MKNTQRLALVATLAVSAMSAQAAGFNFAENGSYPPEVQVQSTLTRAQVIADLQAARANGTMPLVGDHYQTAQSAKGTSANRDQVRQQAASALQSGKLDFGA